MKVKTLHWISDLAINYFFTELAICLQDISSLTLSLDPWPQYEKQNNYTSSTAVRTIDNKPKEKHNDS